MDREDILKRVTQLFSLMTDEEILAESELSNDLGISSMDVLSLMSYVEEEFEIKVGVNDISDMVTVNDVVDFIEDSLNE